MSVCAPRVRGGFSLMEVLVTMGIFTVGFVAVAAIFPSAILLQKRTIQAVEAEAWADAATASLQGVPWDRAQVDAELSIDEGEVLRLTEALWDRWPLADRTLLADTFPNPTLPSGAETFWIPLLFDSDPSPTTAAWNAFVFVVRRDPTVSNYEALEPPDFEEWANPFDGPGSDDGDPLTIPKVARCARLPAQPDGFTLANADDWLDVGDPVLLGNGVAGRVTDIDDDFVELNVLVDTSARVVDVWFVPKPAPNKASAARDLVFVTGVAR